MKQEIPLAEELIELIKYFVIKALKDDFGSFITGSYVCSESSEHGLSKRDTERFAKKLGEDKVKKAFKDAHDEFRRSVSPRLWDIFLNGTKEEWDQVAEEYYAEIGKSVKQIA